jgi:acyl transferase domain-containing protein
VSASEVAVIGYAGRFPGAASVGELWSNLRDGVEAIRRLTPAEVAAAGIPAAMAAHPEFVPVEALPDSIELFDARCFDMTPREAQLTDPQHRMLLECAWEALADAGYDPFRYAGSIGVFAGATINTYLVLHLLADPGLLASCQPVQINIGNAADFLTTRISYKLNLRGPSHAVQSACSTSLLAVQLACQKLLDGECDVALAGGVSLNLTLRGGYLHHEGGMASPDGTCRPFDAAARGTVFGGGAAVVVLRRLADALAGGDAIRAVIKGSAVNNDGAFKLGYTAPGLEGEAAVIAEALANAGVSPDSIGFVEAHGTATPLGDPVEVEALTRAFRAGTARRGFCALGSLKGNLGHLDAAAGLTGLLKAVLALEHELIPPSLHFSAPNPEIDLPATPFFVNSQPLAWPRGACPRRAGISAFGVGGTNAHVVLEEAPLAGPGDAGRPCQLLVLSAHTASALATAARQLASHLGSTPERGGAAFADAAYTLQTGRRELPFRLAVVAGAPSEAAAELQRAAEAGTTERRAAAAPAAQSGAGESRAGARRGATVGRQAPKVAFLFPGQGSLAAGATAALYGCEPLFRAEVDHCCGLLAPTLGSDLRELLYPSPERREWAARELDRTLYAQPALVTLELALAHLWMAWGVRPYALAGHSLGELTGACLAGVLTREQTLALAAERARLMEELPAGAMLSVPLGEEEARLWLDAMAGSGLELAAINGPGRSVLAGPEETIAALERRLLAEGVRGRRLRVRRAFHSAAMEPVLAPFAQRLRTIELRPPRLPYLSNLTGAWARPEQATDPQSWCEQMRRPVRFADNLDELLRTPDLALLEVGPGDTLTRLARQHPAAAGGRLLLASLPAPATEAGAGRAHEAAAPLAALGELWARGLTVDWLGVHHGERRRRIPLPGPVFERQRHWVEARHNPYLAARFPAAEPAAPAGWTAAVEASAAATGAAPSAPAGEPGAPPRQAPAELYVAPATELERRIAAVWRQVLGRERVGVLDGFFDLGGDSLAAVQTIDLLKRELGMEMPATHLYEGTTIRTLAQLLAGEQTAPGTAARRGERAARRQELRQAVRQRRRERPAMPQPGLGPREE